MPAWRPRALLKPGLPAGNGATDHLSGQGWHHNHAEIQDISPCCSQSALWQVKPLCTLRF